MASPGPAHDSRHRGPETRSDEEIRDEIIIDEAEHRIAHPILRPLPLQRGTSDINLRHLFNGYDVVMQQLDDILHAYGIVIWASEFAHMVRPGEVPTDATKVTLLIKSTDFNRFEWEEAVVQVAKKVAQLRNPGPTIIVEIIDYRAINPFTYPIPASNDELIKAWEEWMGQTIMECMSDMEWQTLGLQGRALVPDIAQCRQTVLITAWDASSPYWTVLKANISQATQSFNLAIIVRQAQPWSGAGRSRGSRAVGNMDSLFWAPSVWIGQSMGPLTVPPEVRGTGSVGGKLTLQDKDGEETTAIMTCYHVVETAALAAASAPPPLCLDQTTTAFPVHSPSERDTSAKLELYDARIKNFNEWLYGGNPSRALRVESGKTITYFEEFKIQLDTMLADRDRVAAAPRLFGHVFAHSGCCRIAGPNNTPLDWALMTLAAPRLLENIFPLAYASTAELFDWQLKDVPGWSVAKIGSDCNVMKCGRSTGWTTGKLSTTETWIQLGEKEPWKSSYGSVVSALMVHNDAEVKTKMGQTTFSEGGDSGSWVFDTETGAWIGVLLGGPLYEEYAYITPVDIILRDVEEVTGKKVVEPKEMK
ncbi:hypothetical protein SLS55_001394 [Diplodia seriata]|uniref:Uncharacterized protein n=1 Tax=Diplodia seriata TaxID=420778 RepID=A0ABR3CWY8_9PEZI